MTTRQVHELLAGVEMPTFEDDDIDQCAVIDAIVIFRYQHPDWQRARSAYVVSSGTPPETYLGMMVMVTDRARDTELHNWDGDEDG